MKNGNEKKKKWRQCLVLDKVVRRKKKQEEDRESDGIIREENVKGKEVMEKVNEREESKKKEKKDYRVSLWVQESVMGFDEGKK